MILSLVAVCLALGGTLDARLSQLEERVAALAPGQLETPSHGQHKEDVFKEGAAPEKVTKQASPPDWEADWEGKIYAKDSQGNKCGLEWDGSKSGGERNAKWDCDGRADPLYFDKGAGKIYAIDSDGNKCGLEWDGHLNGLSTYFIPPGFACGFEWEDGYDRCMKNYGQYERNAKWDCGGSADPLVFPQKVSYNVAAGKIYALDNLGSYCGLEWDGSKSGGERNAKWKCTSRGQKRGSADPVLYVPVQCETGGCLNVDRALECSYKWNTPEC